MAFLDTVAAPTSSGGFLGSVTVPTPQARAQAEKVSTLTNRQTAAAANAAQQNSVVGFLKNFMTAIPSATGIPQMASEGWNTAVTNETNAALGNTKTGGLQEGINMVGGVGQIVFSPLAPVLNPISKLLQSAIDAAGGALSNFGPIKDYGNAVVNIPNYDPADEVATKLLNILQGSGNISMALLGAKGKAKIGERPVEVTPKEAPVAPETAPRSSVEPARVPVEPVKPVETAVKVAEKPAAEAYKPIVETPKMVEGKVTKAASDISANLVEAGYKALTFEQQSLFSPGSFKAEAAKIATMMDTNIEHVKDIATGKIEVPPEVKYPQLFFNAVEQYAMKNGDVKLLQGLAKSPLGTQLSEAGATLGSHGFNDTPQSPVAAIREIQKVREEVVRPRRQVITQRIKSAVRKTHTVDTWSSFIKSIEC